VKPLRGHPWRRIRKRRRALQAFGRRRPGRGAGSSLRGAAQRRRSTPGQRTRHLDCFVASLLAMTGRRLPCARVKIDHDNHRTSTAFRALSRFFFNTVLFLAIPPRRPASLPSMWRTVASEQDHSRYHHIRDTAWDNGRRSIASAFTVTELGALLPKEVRFQQHRQAKKIAAAHSLLSRRALDGQLRQLARLGISWTTSRHRSHPSC
jgi:hypothetical protein